jgi:hypothetical protein
MNAAHWVTLVVLTVLLAEGFAMAAFPEDFRRVLADMDPRALMWVGVAEVVIAALLMASLWFTS